MAEDTEDQEQTETEGDGDKGSAGGKKKLILLIVIGLLVVAGSVGGTLFALGFFDADEAELVEGDEAGEVEEEVVDKPSPAMYFPIKPAFVVNFQSRGRQRYLQTDITIMTRDVDAFTALQSHAPLVKNRLVMLLGGEMYVELQTDEGKELLRQKALEALQEIMQQEIGKPGIDAVLFTNFVMQ